MCSFALKVYIHTPLLKAQWFMCIAAEMLYISKWLQTVSLMFEIFNVTYIIISTQKLCFDCVIILVSYAAEMSQYLPLKIGENL